METLLGGRTLIISPWAMKRGTCTIAPVSNVAGLLPPAKKPQTVGARTCRHTRCGHASL